MNPSNMLSRQGQRMLQIGIAHFVFSGLEGFAIPQLPVPALGRSVHTLSGLQGVMLLALGLCWPRLQLGATAARIAFGTYMVVCILISLWYGFGYSTIPFLMIFAGGYFYVGFSSLYVMWRMHRAAELAALALEAGEPIST